MSKRLMSGHEYEQVSEEEAKAMRLDVFTDGVIRILPEGWLYPGCTPKFLNRVQTMQYRKDDVLVVTFPKCGTTWMQEILWTMLHNPNLDNPAASEALWLRLPEISLDMMFDLRALNGQIPEAFVEKFKKVCPDRSIEEGLSLHLADVSPSPRILKSHYPICLMPKDILDKIKVVYVTRNPKDMAVSFFHFFKLVKVFPFDASYEEFLKYLMSNNALYTPYWSHVKDAWSKRNHPNLHFVFYEDMKADIMKELRKLNEFLGTSLSEQTLEGVMRHTSFSAMKSRGEPIQDEETFKNAEEKDVKFFRKGKIGDWKNHFSPEQQSEMDQWTKENLADSDISLDWALAL